MCVGVLQGSSRENDLTFQVCSAENISHDSELLTFASNRQSQEWGEQGEMMKPSPNERKTGTDGISCTRIMHLSERNGWGL